MEIRKYIKLLIILLLTFTCYLNNLNTNATDYEELEGINLTPKFIETVKTKMIENEFTYEVMYDFSFNARYILVEGKSSYLVFDTIIDDYVEYSNQACSEYHDLSKDYKRIYLAPTYHYFQNSDGIFDIISKRKVDNNHIFKYKEFEKALIQNYNLTKRQQELRSQDSYFISDKSYFENLWNGICDDVGNFPGSCTFIALGMALSYIDTYKNDNVIEDSFDYTTTLLNKPNIGAVNIEEYNDSPGAKLDFLEYLITLARSNHLTTSVNSCSIYFQDMPNFIDLYIDEVSVNLSTTLASRNDNKIVFTKNALDNDIPVILGIIGPDIEDPTIQVRHAVIAYGYDEDGIVVNYGYSWLNYTAVNINNYVIGEAIYLEYGQTNHVCSNNYRFITNDFSGYICPCSRYQCNHAHTSYRRANDYRHSKICNFCSHQISTEPHELYPYNSNYECSKCGCVVNEFHYHDYTYRPLSGLNHRKTCICGTSSVEPCIFGHDNYMNLSCIFCGKIRP